MELTHLYDALALVAQPFVLGVILVAAIFGLFVGAVPGLSATMAVALLVPVTFFMDPVPAIAMMVTSTAMAITSGDIPGCLLRIPGTPSSAAYTDEAYAMTRKGLANEALGASIVFSCIGGLFGTVVLITCAPMLAEFALNFSSYEFFLAGCAGAVLRHLHFACQHAARLRLIADRPVPGLRGNEQSGGVPAIYLRQ